MRINMPTMQVESDSLHEAKRFWQKDPSKKTLIAFLGATSLIRPGKGTLIRSLYYFVRGIDDLLDGEYVGDPITADPKGYAEDIKYQIVKNGTVQPNDRLTRLGNYAVPRIFRLASKNDNVGVSISTLIDEMVFDYDRRQNRAVSNAIRLKQNYTGGLDESLNLLFVALGSSIRSRDIGAYSFAQGRLYAARDLEKDWGLGIINVPSEVLIGRAKLTSEVPYSELIAEPLIETWLQGEITQGVDDMKKSLGLASDFFQRRSHSFLPDPGLVVLKGLGNGIVRSVRTIE